MKRIIFILPLLLIGCASDKADKPANPTAPSKMQADAVRDPFGYGPGKDFGKDSPKAPDSEDSLKDEWKRLWNP